jgi:lipopolysaccharide transport system ATP-binding protein
MNSAILVDGLSKKYQISHLNRVTTLRESLMGLLNFQGRRKSPVKDEVIWALRDVSFSIQRGETVGIIGRNGAGKSTLLKVLSRITYATSGSVDVRGRVAALLEVGTGFHQELTGRENIYLNGSILGMPKKEVERKLDAIVEFSGVEKFIDTPIKRYSSGMRLRLGFAVAAHLDPDILIVDEVLAVGDAAFQKKCVNVMEGLRESARTVLFVSHNLAAVENLCSRCIWIEGGQVRMDGESRRVIDAYMGNVNADSAAPSNLDEVKSRKGDGEIRYTRVEFVSPEGRELPVIRSGDPLVIRFHYFAKKPIVQPSFGFRMYTDLGTLVTDTGTSHHGISISRLEPGGGYIDLEVSCLNLLPRKYVISLWLTDPDGVKVYDNIENAMTLEVEMGNVYQSGRVVDGKYGILYFPQRWNLAGTICKYEQLKPSLTQSDESLVL